MNYYLCLELYILISQGGKTYLFGPTNITNNNILKNAKTIILYDFIKNKNDLFDSVHLTISLLHDILLL